MSNLEKLELCAKVMEEYGNHGAAFYIREAIEELARRYMEKMSLTEDGMLMIENNDKEARKRLVKPWLESQGYKDFVKRFNDDLKKQEEQ